jgi:hypothetical protein
MAVSTGYPSHIATEAARSILLYSMQAHGDEIDYRRMKLKAEQD